MSNECMRVITLLAVTEICRKLQEENISISCQAIMCAEKGCSRYTFPSIITIPR